MGLVADIRTKPALASSSLAASVKTIQDGKARLAVKRETYADLLRNDVFPAE